MKVEELIEKLKNFKSKLGNVNVDVIIEDIDGTKAGFLPINKVDISKDENGNNPEIYIGYFAENDKNNEEE